MIPTNCAKFSNRILAGERKKKERGHPDLNRGPLDLQSNALPLSYTPIFCFKHCHMQSTIDQYPTVNTHLHPLTIYRVMWLTSVHVT